MRRLHHVTLCPFSRAARLILAEKKLDFQLVPERLYAHGVIKIDINPAGKVPILSESGGPSSSVYPTAVSIAPRTRGQKRDADLQGIADEISIDAQPDDVSSDALPLAVSSLAPETGESLCVNGALPIAIYLDARYPAHPMMGETPFEQSEIARLFIWADMRLFLEAVYPVIQEKILKRLSNGGPPDSQKLRYSHTHIHQHLMALCYLLSQRACLAGDDLTAADFAIAAHISLLDYLGTIDWRRYAPLQLWYARLKSRPSFRPLLQEVIAGIPAAPHYSSLDF